MRFTGGGHANGSGGAQILRVPGSSSYSLGDWLEIDTSPFHSIDSIHIHGTRAHRPLPKPTRDPTSRLERAQHSPDVYDGCAEIADISALTLAWLGGATSGVTVDPKADQP